MTYLTQDVPQKTGSPDLLPNDQARQAGPNKPTPSNRGWILGPWLDLLLISNVIWPLLVFFQHYDTLAGRMTIQFWQIYFITTPHRWSTLALVMLDRNPFRARPRFFIAFAAMVVSLCVGIYISTGALTCLLAIDYLWNAWHFAAQHHGIYRIYGRLSHAPSLLPGWTEKWLLRSFLLYCILRVAQVAIRPGALSDALSITDWIALALPGMILLDVLWNFNRQSLGRLTYLISVTGLFLGMLWAIHNGHPAILLALTTASAWFHASEYLAVVGWRLQKQNSDGTIHSRDAALKWIASRWAVSLLIFMVILGSCGWMLESHFLEYWLLLNVIAAFLHYGYDGVLWKKQSPKTPPVPETIGSSSSSRA